MKLRQVSMLWLSLKAALKRASITLVSSEILYFKLSSNSFGQSKLTSCTNWKQGPLLYWVLFKPLPLLMNCVARVIV